MICNDPNLTVYIGLVGRKALRIWIKQTYRTSVELKAMHSVLSWYTLAFSEYDKYLYCSLNDQFRHQIGFWTGVRPKIYFIRWNISCNFTMRRTAFFPRACASRIQWRLCFQSFCPSVHRGGGLGVRESAPCCYKSAHAHGGVCVWESALWAHSFYKSAHTGGGGKRGGGAGKCTMSTFLLRARSMQSIF